MTQARVQTRIGFVTCAEHRHLYFDDLILAAALERLGVRVCPVVWTETSPRDIACELVVLRSVWDYHLHPQVFEDWVRAADERIPLLNAPEIVRWNINKMYLREIEAKGFRIPKTVFLERGSVVDLPAVARNAGFEELIVKPAISASAFETHRLSARQAGDFNGRLNALLQSRAMLLQEFVEEIGSDGEWSLVFFDGEFSHAAHKLPRAGDFRVQHEFGGTYRAAAPPTPLLETAGAIVSRFAEQAAYCRVDMVLREPSPVLMELELIDPLLHFELAPEAAEKLANRLVLKQLTSRR